MPLDTSRARAKLTKEQADAARQLLENTGGDFTVIFIAEAEFSVWTGLYVLR